MDCVVTPLKTLMGFSVHLNVQLKFYNLPNVKSSSHRIYSLSRITFFAYKPDTLNDNRPNTMTE